MVYHLPRVEGRSAFRFQIYPVDDEIIETDTQTIAWTETFYPFSNLSGLVLTEPKILRSRNVCTFF